MRRFRSVMVCVFLLSLVAALPSQALCVKCKSDNTCWAESTATAKECSSFGTACATMGKCSSSGGGDCEIDYCGPDEQWGSLEELPLRSEYMLVAVSIEQEKPAAIALASAPAVTAAQ